AHTRQVLDTTATDQHHRVLLQVMALTADVRDDLEPVGETHLCDLTQRRVRPLRGRGVDASAHAALLRAGLERRDLALGNFHLARLADKLIDCWHSLRISHKTAAAHHGPPRADYSGCD